MDSDVKGFYEQFPYPGMEFKDSVSLVKGIHSKIMANSLATCGIGRDWLKGKKVLDAGCGTGEKSIYCSHHGADVIGIDLSKNSLERAIKTASKFRTRVDFQQKDITGLEWREEFDLIIHIGVLHHIREHGLAFSRLARALKPNGLIVVGFYNSYGRLRVDLEKLFLRMRFGTNEEIISHFRKTLKKDYLVSIAIDKYLHPYEKSFSYSYVGSLFRKNQMDLLGSYPMVNTPVVDELSLVLKNRFFMFMGGRKKY